MNASNPYRSPSQVDVDGTALPSSLTARRLASDVLAGMLVGATYGSLGGACVAGLRTALFGDIATVYERVEQTFMAAVFGAFTGAIGGLVMGTVLALLMGIVFRALRLEGTIGFYWGAITLAAVAGSLSGFLVGFLFTQRPALDPIAMIWYPLGAVVGGMIGAMAGRQWVRVVAGREASPFSL